MPFVVCYYNSDKISAAELKIALRELVPAAFNCTGEGALTPGSIEARIKKQNKEDDFNVDTFVSVEAYDLDERRANLQDRSDDLQTWLKKLFPNVSFACWPKLVRAAWTSDSPDEDFDGPMAMEHAYARAFVELATHRREEGDPSSS